MRKNNYNFFGKIRDFIIYFAETFGKKKHFWAIDTLVGEASVETIKKYIENQGQDFSPTTKDGWDFSLDCFERIKSILKS